MSQRARASSFLRGVVALAAVAALLVPVTPVHAADVSFGIPEADATFGEGIEFSVPITAGIALARVELQLRFPDTLGPHLLGLDVPAAGTHTLTYTLDLSEGGFLEPNTPVVATWAAYTSLDADPVLSQPLTVRYSDTNHEWRTLKGDVVTVHWYEGNEAFARRALRIADNAVLEAASLLGVTESDPIDLFIYADNASFRSALSPGTRENVAGRPYAGIRTLVALVTPEQINDAWVGVVIPHELVHLVFHTAVRNPYRFPPLWLNEGIATYLSEGYGPGDRYLVAEAVSSGDLLPLTALDQFPRYGDRVNLAYAESVSAVDHLVRTDGDDALFALIGAYRDGLTDDEAFTKALGRDVGAFQSGWLEELGAGEPQRYGPQPAPPGPLPPGWSGPATPSGDGGSDAGSGPGAVLAAILAVVAVVAVVAIAMVVARRRGAPA